MVQKSLTALRTIGGQITLRGMLLAQIHSRNTGTDVAYTSPDLVGQPVVRALKPSAHLFWEQKAPPWAEQITESICRS